MGMSAMGLALFSEMLKHTRLGVSPRSVLAFGYPDILASPEQIRQIFGQDVFEKLVFRADSADIIRWHNASDITDRVVDTFSLFSTLGLRLEVSDVVEARGGEVIIDLNHPCSASLHGRYDVLLDSGTLEHCFNIAQAAKNMAELVRIGGCILHGNPMNMYNHGFYNLNPTWYADFYGDNGFDVLYLRAEENPLRAPAFHDVPRYNRFQLDVKDVTLSCIVRKVESRSIVWPVQTKYKNNPTLKI